MRKAVIFLLILGCILGTAVPAYAAEAVPKTVPGVRTETSDEAEAAPDDPEETEKGDLRERLSQAWDKFSDAAKEAGEAIGEAASALGEDIAEKASALGDTIRDMLKELFPSDKDEESGYVAL